MNSTSGESQTDRQQYAETGDPHPIWNLRSGQRQKRAATQVAARSRCNPCKSV